MLCCSSGWWSYVKLRSEVFTYSELSWAVCTLLCKVCQEEESCHFGSNTLSPFLCPSRKFENLNRMIRFENMNCFCFLQWFSQLKQHCATTGLMLQSQLESLKADANIFPTWAPTENKHCSFKDAHLLFKHLFHTRRRSHSKSWSLHLSILTCPLSDLECEGLVLKNHSTKASRKTWMLLSSAVKVSFLLFRFQGENI